MWHLMKSELTDNKFSLALAGFAVASLLTIHTVWGDWLDLSQVRTLVFLMCVTGALLTLHVNRIYSGGTTAPTMRGTLARLGLVALFWLGTLGAFVVMSRSSGTVSADSIWGLLSASGLLVGLNAIFALSSAARSGGGVNNVDRIVATLFEALLVGAALFWALLLSGYFEAAMPIRGFLFYVFFTPLGAAAHVLLGVVLTAACVAVFGARRTLSA